MEPSETKAYDEKTPLLRQHGVRGIREIKPVPMEYGDMPRGADTIVRAFKTDSLMKYFDDVDTAPFPDGRAKARYYLMFEAGIRQHRQLAIDGGSAVLKYQIPGGPGDPWVHTYLTSAIYKLSSTRELLKRIKDFESKTFAAVMDAFGEKISEMYEIQSLGTAPEAQGQGFGSALVTAVTDLADADSHDVWLVTTDAHLFYEGLGFSTVRSFVVGDDNPAWNGAPMQMLRPWKKSVEDVVSTLVDFTLEVDVQATIST